MLGSAILEVGIGITFIYLFLSLIGTAINEFISGVFKLRSKNLEEGIRSILNDPDGKGLSKEFYDHPLVKGLAKDKRKPSYISSRVFAIALMDIIAPVKTDGEINTFTKVRESVSKIKQDELKKAIMIHLNEAENDIKKARQNIEKWFDEVMERVSGWYKRKSQWIILGFAVTVTIIFNVDTIQITSNLYHDATLRAGLVAAAEGIAKEPLSEHYGDTKGKIKEINAELDRLKFPFGWHMLSQDKEKSQKGLPDNTLGWLVKIFGWIMTAFALSLGAPFWFDMLNKFTNIRSAGKKPLKTQEEK